MSRVVGVIIRIVIVVLITGFSWLLGIVLFGAVPLVTSEPALQGLIPMVVMFATPIVMFMVIGRTKFGEWFYKAYPF